MRWVRFLYQKFGMPEFQHMQIKQFIPDASVRRKVQRLAGQKGVHTAEDQGWIIFDVPLDSDLDVALKVLKASSVPVPALDF
jgi:hypothetical protein